MEVEKGVMAAVFKDNGRALVLKRKKNWEGWELLKGGLENNDYRETVLLELKEEAGIPGELVNSIKDLDFTTTWKYTRNGEKRRKEYKAFALKVSNDALVDTSNNPSDEHENGFFLRPRHIKEMLEYENGKKVLEKACNEFNIKLK